MSTKHLTDAEITAVVKTGQTDWKRLDGRLTVVQCPGQKREKLVKCKRSF